MLHQGQLSSGFLCKTPSCSAKPKESTVHLPQQLCEMFYTFYICYIYVLYAYTNSHVRRGRVEVNFGGKEEIACPAVRSYSAEVPSQPLLPWKDVSFGRGPSLSCLLSLSTKVQHSLSGNITLFRLKKNNPDSGRNPEEYCFVLLLLLLFYSNKNISFK